MEIQFGINMLDDGKKKANLKASFSEMIEMRFQKRILEFDINSAIETAGIASTNRRHGVNTSIQDLQIIGIAKSKGAVIATRNEKDFSNCGVTVINPWQ